MYGRHNRLQFTCFPMVHYCKKLLSENDQHNTITHCWCDTSLIANWADWLFYVSVMYIINHLTHHKMIKWRQSSTEHWIDNLKLNIHNYNNNKTLYRYKTLLTIITRAPPTDAIYALQTFVDNDYHHNALNSFI